MSESQYDLVVVGGGPGGYVAAIRAAQLGLKTACVEKRGSLGGTCLNVGCIPSKALLQSSETYAEAKNGLAQHGVKAGKVELDLKAMMGRKDKVVSDLTKGIEFLFKKNKVDYVKGAGRITKAGEGGAEVTVDGKDRLAAKNVCIATGSDHMPLPGVEIDEKQVVSSTGALSLAKVPKHMVVVGAGYIGLEMGSVWARLGAEVTCIEFLDRVLPGMDAECGKACKKVLEKEGFTFKLAHKVTGAKAAKSGVTLSVEPAKGGEAERIKADIVLVAIGRRPFTEALGAEDVGLRLDNAGRIEVDGHFATGVPGLYAIGDVIKGPMLAHKAEEEGVALAETLAGGAGHVNYETCPGVVYTWPEIAYVGKSEEELKEAGVDYAVGKFPNTANARARCNAFTEGFVKILADKRTDRILGGHIVGAAAGELIHEVVTAMEFGASAEDLARTFHGHPTLNESIKEAALAVAGRAVHA